VIFSSSEPMILTPLFSGTGFCCQRALNHLTGAVPRPALPVPGSTGEEKNTAAVLGKRRENVCLVKVPSCGKRTVSPGNNDPVCFQSAGNLLCQVVTAAGSTDNRYKRGKHQSLGIYRNDPITGE
jgi:hypothetical protein